jgi:hypothetical protein
MTTNRRSHYAAGRFLSNWATNIMHADVVDLLMSMTLARVRALITTAFRSKQTSLIHSLTYSMERWLTLPFRSAKHTYCYSLSHALTLTYSSNVKWLFIIVEQRSKKRKNRSRRARTHSYNYHCPTSIMHIYIYIYMIVLFHSNIKLCTSNRFQSWGSIWNMREQETRSTPQGFLDMLDIE